jgi:predicted dehydrogenase
MNSIRWGIMATGGIAGKFAEALALIPEAQIAAVGSRTQAKAEEFGATWNIPKRYGSYRDLARDPEVDVVYIATPHSLHRDNCIECLEAGRAVLCEKPLAVNAGQAREVVDLARRKNLFLMEAMWTRFFPAIKKVREILASGILGDVLLVQADFGFRVEFNPKSRLFDPALAGGALLDLGVYPVSLASMVYGGPPKRVFSTASKGKTGVDEQIAAILEYPDGRQAVFSCSFRFESPKEAHIIGTDGRILIHRQWWNPESITLTRKGLADEDLSLPMTGNGYAHEALEVMECLSAGRKESASMPLDETLTIMQTLDLISAAWGS